MDSCRRQPRAVRQETRAGAGMNPQTSQSSGYKFTDAGHCHSHAYLLPTLGKVLDEFQPAVKKVFDLGCGNGSVAAWLASRGWNVAGVDPSQEGIAQAKMSYPTLPLHLGSCYENLVDRYGRFPFVISLEVVEHVYAPREFARCTADLLEPGGVALISTPYHGYFKNLILAVTGKMDGHFT